MPKALGSGNISLDAPDITVSIGPTAFDVAIGSQGVKLVHMRAMKCPVGLSDPNDIRRTHDDHSGCSNGFIYTKAGEATSLFTGNPNKMDSMDMGLKDGGTVNVTFPRTYDDSDDFVSIMPYDRLYLNEEAILVPHTQLVQSHETGRDRLDFPAVNVIDLMDSTGARHTSSEYDITDGQIVWKNGGLGYDPIFKRGMTYSIRYEYRPYYYVQRLSHQIRVAQEDTETGRVMRRMPQAATLQREYVFLKNEKDAEAPDPEQRQVKGPRFGGFGPR